MFTSRKWLTVAIFLKWQDCSVAIMDYHGQTRTITDYHGLSWTIMDYYWLLQAGPKIGFDIGNGREITGFLSIFNDQDHVEDC